MDVRCPKCNEPWDNDELHETIAEDWYRAHSEADLPTGDAYRPLYTAIVARFQQVGCEVFGTSHADTEANPGVALIYELLGDDMDGAASLIEDAEAGGLM